MAPDPETSRNARDRLTRVFHYLEALNQHRNPVKRQVREQLWALWFRDLPDHPAILRGSFEESTTDNDRPAPLTDSGLPRSHEDFVLRVRRPALTRSPSPPETIANWLEHGWEDPHGGISIRESQNEADGRGETRVVRFDEDSRRVQALEAWRALRERWAHNERPARKSMKIFEQLYELHGQIEREGERVELILGDGILIWRRPEGGVHHPVLLQRVQLEFNPSVPEFTILETEHELELYSALFRAMPDVEGKLIARCREEVAQQNCHPLGEGATSAFLKSFAVRLSPHGRFMEQGSEAVETEHPCIGRDAVLFLRSRTLGFATAIEGVLEDLRSRDDLPGPMLRVVGIESTSDGFGEGETPSSTAAQEVEVLFSKESNPEQIQIAQRLEQHGAVLVQGPPGTGKSHTIANLIGHLLADGKSVLVTAHTTKALRVLRDYVAEQLRPLCVSVLDRDLEGRSQLEAAVAAIVERLSRSDAKKLEAQAEGVAAERRKLLSERQKAWQELLRARTDEYRDIVVAGESHRPSDAARRVARCKTRDGWIPGPVISGFAMPLTEGELVDLYRTNTSVSPDDEHELSVPLPKAGSLPAPEDFRALIEERNRLAARDLSSGAALWTVEPTPEESERLQALAEKLCQAVGIVNEEDGLTLATVSAGRAGGVQLRPWETLIEMIERTCEMAAAAQEELLHNAPRIGDEVPLEEQAAVLDEILGHLSRSRRLSGLALLARPAWRRVIGASKVAAGRPVLPEHFRALRTLVRLKVLRRDLADRWDRQVVPLGGPGIRELGEEVEDTCAQFVAGIRRGLSWYAKVWLPLQKELTGLGFRWQEFIDSLPPKLTRYGELLRLRGGVLAELGRSLAAKADTLRLKKLEASIASLARELQLLGGRSAASQVVRRLQDAVARVDSSAYRESFERLSELWRLGSVVQRRLELLGKLEKAAPAWASSIRERGGVHGKEVLPGDPSAAWLWIQLQQELEKRSRTSLKALQDQIARLDTELRRLTIELIDIRAWGAQLRRTTLPQRQALVGWLDIVRRIGKGTGKRVPRLRLEASQKMNDCRTAVPVWVMPLSRVVENFDPRTTRFDVVIIDEASQSDVMALLAFYIARKVVVVGDHEQVSPSAVGQDLAVVQHLIDEHLGGIPNAILYDGQMSIYDLARQSFGGVICLLEHFRCVPEIIQFSNQLSYQGRIKPLRDPSQVRLKPGVIAFRASPGRSQNKINRDEAFAIAALMVAACGEPEYEGKSIGVVSLVGEEQAVEIERLIRAHLSPQECERRRILCGNAAQFQGDERDVMFLSVVDAAEGGPLPLREEQRFKQRFNVAASRAKDQMWVVFSLDPQTDLKGADLRRRLIEYAQNPSAWVAELEKAEKKAESELEREVMGQLVRAGYQVRPQWRVGHFRIDIVVEGRTARLAVECDGDRFHPLDRLQEDMERQAILERLGWRFVRIRGNQFFRDPEATMQPVYETLKILGIEPGSASGAAEKPDEEEGKELRERVVRKAQELITEWRGTGGSELGAWEEGEEEPAQRTSTLETQDVSQMRELKESVLARLRKVAEPLRKDELLSSTSVPESAWRATIDELKAEGKVIQEGDRRGARYRLGGQQGLRFADEGQLKSPARKLEQGERNRPRSGGNGKDQKGLKAYELGSIVEHYLYGQGRVELLEGSGDELKVTVNFTQHGRKKFMARYAPLRRVE